MNSRFESNPRIQSKIRRERLTVSDECGRLPRKDHLVYPIVIGHVNALAADDVVNAVAFLLRNLTDCGCGEHNRENTNQSIRTQPTHSAPHFDASRTCT